MLLVSTLFFIFPMLISQQASAFSEQRLQKYLQQAQQSNLWMHPQWIKLGHYEKNLFGGYTSAFTSGLFLHEKGYKSPQDELLVTLQALYSPSIDLSEKLKQHPQCYYLARTRWLNKILNVDAEDILPCLERKMWKEKLNAKQASIIFAAADFGNASSSFGHTFLKLKNPQNAQNKDLIDYGIDYAAQTGVDSQGILYAVKGLVGSYQGQFSMLPYHQKIREYINLDGRDIWEYNLDFTEDEVDFLVDHLLEMEQARAPYYFFSDNCSYQILKSLEVVRPQNHVADSFSYFVIPTDTVKKMIRKTNWIHEWSSKKSLKSDYLEDFSQLNSLQKKALYDAVEKLKISEKYQLDNKEKAAVLETAMKYLSLKSYRTGQDLDESKYQLFLKRSALGQIENHKQPSLMQPPHLSHDSSAVYLGYGQQKYDQSLNQVEPYSSFKFRHAFHDLEQLDFGTVPFSHNEMLSFEGRYAIDRKKFQLYDVTLLQLTNLNPTTQLDKNMAWKVSAHIYDQWRPDLEGSVGVAVDYNILHRLRAGYFLTVRHWQNEQDSTNNGLGPEIFLAGFFSDRLGFSLSETYFLKDRKDDQWRLQSKINVNLSHSFDVQIHFTKNQKQDEEIGATLIYNFLL